MPSKMLLLLLVGVAFNLHQSAYAEVGLLNLTPQVNNDQELKLVYSYESESDKSPHKSPQIQLSKSLNLKLPINLRVYALNKSSGIFNTMGPKSDNVASINASQIGIKIGNFFFADGQRKHDHNSIERPRENLNSNLIYQLEVDVSIVPFLYKKPINDRNQAELKAEIDSFRLQADAGFAAGQNRIDTEFANQRTRVENEINQQAELARQNLFAAISASPLFANIPPGPQRDDLIQEAVNTAFIQNVQPQLDLAKQTANMALDAAQSNANAQLDLQRANVTNRLNQEEQSNSQKLFDRVQSLTRLLAFKKLAMTFGYELDDQKMILLTIGRAEVTGGSKVNYAGETAVEQSLVQNILTQHYNDSFYTTQASVAFVYNITKKRSLNLSLTAFHDNGIYFETFNFISRSLAQVSDQDFKDLKRFIHTDLDAQLLKLIYTSERVDFNASVLNGEDGQSYQLGLRLKHRFSEQTNAALFTDYGTGQREYSPEEALLYGLQLNTQIGLPLSLSVYREILKNYTASEVSRVPFQKSDSLSANLNVTLLNLDSGRFRNLPLRLTTGAKCSLFKDTLINNESYNRRECVIGMSAKILIKK